MARRFFGVLVMLLLACAAALPLSGVAHASDDTEADDAVSGACAATVAGESGEPLTVDADAAVGELGLPALRLGSTSDTERRAYSDAVEVPAGDLLETVTTTAEDTGAGAVTDTACEAVDTTADTVNRVAKTTRTTLAVDSSADAPEIVLPAEPEPEEPTQPQPDDVQGIEIPVDEVPAGYTLPFSESIMGFGLPEVALPKIPAMPDAAAQRGPDLQIGGRTDYDTTNTGQAAALPGTPPEQPARAPFVLAVALLAVVAAVFVRRWVTRTAG